EAVLDVHPSANVALHECHPVAVPLLERLCLARGVDVRVDLPDHVGVVAVESELPFLVRVAELVPAESRPVITPAAGHRETCGLWPVAPQSLQGGPVKRVPAATVGEAVQPALAQVVPRIGL